MRANSPILPKQSQQYLQLRQQLDRLGRGKFSPAERECLLEASDALLFGEEQAEQQYSRAQELLQQLQQCDRLSTETAQRLSDLLDGCGVPQPINA